MSSLFERLDTLADDFRVGGGDVDSVAVSVRRHLHKLLNTRAGSASFQPGYGISDFNDVARENPDLSGAVAREIADLIVRLEPRLSQVRVMPRLNPDDPTNLHFIVACEMTIRPGTRKPATFDLSIGRGRRAVIR